MYNICKSCRECFFYSASLLPAAVFYLEIQFLQTLHVDFTSCSPFLPVRAAFPVEDVPLESALPREALSLTSALPIEVFP